MNKVKLSNGTYIPQVGLGLWKNTLPSSVNKTIEAAIEVGYTHFDTAQIYGNEKYLQEALDKMKVDRSSIFITTKVWNNNHLEGRFQRSFERSLKKLDTEYVDLLLIHFPVTRTRQQAWKYMEQVYKDGQAKAIGVSNYTIKHLKELLKSCEIKPMVNQVELHVFLQQPDLLAFCKENDIIVEAYSPLAHGHGLDNPVLVEIGKKYKKSSAQIMIRWCIEMGTVPLPKSTHKERLEENIAVFDFKLDKEDMEKLTGLENDLRTCWDPTGVA